MAIPRRTSTTAVTRPVRAQSGTRTCTSRQRAPGNRSAWPALAAVERRPTKSLADSKTSPRTGMSTTGPEKVAGRRWFPWRGRCRPRWGACRHATSATKWSKHYGWTTTCKRLPQSVHLALRNPLFVLFVLFVGFLLSAAFFELWRQMFYTVSGKSGL